MTTQPDHDDVTAKLPDEIWLDIIAWMNPTDIVRLSEVNTKLRKIGRDRGTWRNIIKDIYNKYTDPNNTSEDLVQLKPDNTNVQAEATPVTNGMYYEQNLWFLYKKFEHSFNKIYTCNHPEMVQSSPNYALTPLPCNQVIQFYRCRPMD